MKLICALCVASTLVSGSTFAQARSQSDEPVIVKARPSNDFRVRKVNYADLNLATSDGERKLYRRVSAAIGEACFGFEGSFTQSISDHSCQTLAWNGAKPQIERAIDRAGELAAYGHSSLEPVAILIASAR